MSKVINACFSLSCMVLNHSIVAYVFFHRLTFVLRLTCSFILSKMCLLIMPISDLLGFKSLQVGLFMKSSLWSLNVINNESLLADTSILSSSLSDSAIFLSSHVILLGTL